MVGSRKDKYQGLVQEDLDCLLTVLDWANELDLKVVLTFLTVPGRVFAQQNGGKQDMRLWQSFSLQDEAVQFFNDVALYVGHHPALFALNPINEPAPEMVEPAFDDWYQGDYEKWYQLIKGTPRDLNSFYERVVRGIRKVRNQLPVMIDSGLYGNPFAFKYLRPIDDPHMFYSFHWYMPFVYASAGATKFAYPGKAPVEETKYSDVILWDKDRLHTMLGPGTYLGP